MTDRYKDTVKEMDKPVIAQKAPFPVEIEAGKNYFYCTCGKSGNQPFCDGSHQGSSFQPKKIEAEETKTVYFCGCRHSKKGHLCDGTHKDL